MTSDLTRNAEIKKRLGFSKCVGHSLSRQTQIWYAYAQKVRKSRKYFISFFSYFRKTIW